MAGSGDHLNGLSAEAERRLERLFHSFDAAWKSGTRPRIADFLPSGPAPERHAALFEFVLIDLEYAIGRDASARVEAYLVEFPELAADRDFVLDLVDREYRMRRERGASPSLREYVARFPDLAARLVLRLSEEDSSPKPEPFEADKTDSYHGKTPTPGSHPSGRPMVDSTVPIALPDEGTPRYRHIRPYARGGLGEVFVAEDTILPRKVALKRIRPHLAADETVRGRFLREAEITARLEHPGVAPIYELIVDKTGQLWYVMRFLEGQTLRSAVEKYHKGKASDDEEGRTLEFRRLLTRFLSACETMSYAHGLGVVHRDLTPANIMLGKNGETVVLDWGFATASGDPEAGIVAVSLGPVASPLDASLMKSGKLFGTPAFMSPEQAAMKQSMVGPASDIYCLGAILYMILVGRPPFAEPDLPKTLEKVIAGDYPKARELKPATSPALEAICLKAMSLKQEDRYSDARDLGRDIERWLADEPVFAYKPPRSERMARWARKHRKRLVLASTAAVVLMLAVGAGVGFAIRSKLERLRQATVKAGELIEGANALAAAAKEDEAKLGEALHKAELAVEQLRGAGVTGDALEAAVRTSSVLNRTASNRRLVRELDMARQLGTLEKDGVYDPRKKIEGYQVLLLEYGLDVRAGSDTAAKAIQDSQIGPYLVATLDDWALELDQGELRDGLLLTANKADPSPLGKDLRNAIQYGKSADLVSLSQRIDPAVTLPTQLHTVGYALVKAGRLADAAAFLDRAYHEHADFWIHTRLGQVYNGLASESLTKEGRQKLYQKAAYHFGAAADRALESPYALLNLADAKLRLPDESEEAFVRYKKAESLSKGDPDVLYHYGFGLSTVGRYGEAAAKFEAALRSRPDSPEAHSALVLTRWKEREVGKAVAFYRAWLQESPDAPGVHAGLGLALHNLRQFEEAEKEYRAAIRIKRDYAFGHYLLGGLMTDLRRHDWAINEQRESIASDPVTAMYQLGLGRALARAGQFDEAEKCLRGALGRHSRSREARYELGICLLALDRTAEAVAELKQGTPAMARRGDEDAEEHAARNARFLEKLPKYLGEKPEIGEGEEAMAVARMCRQAHRHSQATRLWARILEGAQTGDARWKAYLTEGAYLEAAHAAALAASAGKPAGGDELAQYSELTYVWLGEHAGYLKSLIVRNKATKPAAIAVLREWFAEPDFARFRDPPRLAELPDEDRLRWSELWKELKLLADDVI